MRVKSNKNCCNAGTKKAFTLTEMLICILCIGLLTVALTVFYSSVTGAATTIAKQKDVTLEEYSDVSLLSNSGKSIKLLMGNPSSVSLHYPENLIEAARINKGDTHTINHGIKMQTWYELRFVSADPSIARVDDDGNVLGVSEGVTYITVSLYVVNGGAETETDVTRVFPVQVYSSSMQNQGRSVQYYFYNGRYVKSWIVEDGEV